jgi:hypothetical protein
MWQLMLQALAKKQQNGSAAEAASQPNPTEAAPATGPASGSWGGMAEMANAKFPGMVNKQGAFSPMDAAKQRYYNPYFGQNGVFNFTQNGPWRRE